MWEDANESFPTKILGGKHSIEGMECDSLYGVASRSVYCRFLSGNIRLSLGTKGQELRVDDSVKEFSQDPS